MRDIKDLCARIEDELSKIADNGLTTGNLEMTYKLIDMYKDIKNTQYWDKKVEYYNTVLDEMRGGYNDDYSERGRKHLSFTVFRFAGTIALFLRHIVVICVSSVRAAVMPSNIMFTTSGIRTAPVVIWHHSAVICAVKERCLPLWKNILTNSQQK